LKKLKKCLNLYFGHRLSSSGFVLNIKIAYPDMLVFYQLNGRRTEKDISNEKGGEVKELMG